MANLSTENAMGRLNAKSDDQDNMLDMILTDKRQKSS
jgi:hypothetical protein